MGAIATPPASPLAATAYTYRETQLKLLPIAPLVPQFGGGQAFQGPQELRDFGGTQMLVQAVPALSLRWTELPQPQVVTQPLATPGPTLTQLPQRPVAQPLPYPRSQPAPEPATTTVTPFTFNGGIHVQIAATTIDRDHAQETARTIAGHVLTEINRITERDRFRRGLPPLSTRF